MEMTVEPPKNGFSNGNGHSPSLDKSTQTSDLTRLLSVAIISRRFRELLLNDPAAALADGFYGQQFELTPEEQEFVLSMHATSLSEFATQVSHFHGHMGTNSCSTAPQP